MIRSGIGCLVLCVALAACGDRTPKTPKLSDALPNLPLPPQATFVSRASGSDALQITVRSPVRADLVAAYYRSLFKTGGWRLVSDATDADSATVLLAQQDGPPLWVRIRNADDGRGTLVELTGAVLPKPDSSAAKPAS